MNTLVAALAEICARDPAAEKRLLAPSRRTGHQWLEASARAGRPALNCRVETLRSLAVALAAPALARDGLSVVPRRAALLLVDRALAALRSGRLRYLGAAAPGAGLAAALLRSIEDLRLAGVPAARLGRGRLEDDGKAADLKAVLAGYLALLDRERLVDHARVLELARERLAADPAALGPATTVLLPADLEPAALERALLDALPAGRLRVLPVDPPGVPGRTRFARAVGEVNEVRAALRSCLARGVPLDAVELLHTDATVYVPLVLETFAALARPGAEPGDDPPATFAEGVPCAASRPGRALRAWLRWAAQRHPQQALVAMIREGLLAIDAAAGDAAGPSRLAALLRGIPVGFGRERYLPRIDAALAALALRRTGLAAGDESGDEEVARARGAQLERDRQALEALRALVGRLLAVTPGDDAAAPAVAAAAGRFLHECARSASRLDAYAAELLGREVAALEAWLARAPDLPAAEVRAWLEALPAEARVLGSGPRPGCLHVDHVAAGGHSGRPHTLVVGLDDARFPGAGLQDPILLDHERRGLSPGMPTAAGGLGRRVLGFQRLLGRLRGEVTLSWPARDLVEDRDRFPSPVVLEAYRAASGSPDADQEALLRATGAPASFAPAGPDEALDLPEWWLWRFTAGAEVANADALLARHAPALAHGREAEAARAAATFTAWDGLVPAAGAILDPAAAGGKVLSANGLETAGACPRRFFFRYALEIAPPEELAVDPGRWLDPLVRGSLLHGLFEDFLRELAGAGRLPEFARDRPRLLALLAGRIAAARQERPVPSAAVFARERAELTATAETFLRAEEEHCRGGASTPTYLEAAIGMAPAGAGTALDAPELAAVSLAGGGVIRTRGRVDRVDRLGGAPGEPPGWAIWDYKTGSAWGFHRADPFAEGRKVQPWLYIRMVEARLRQVHGAGERVRSFGYFFPGTKADGERISWPPERLAGGEEIVALLCRGIAGGAFVATTDAQRDCGLCDYRGACGDLEALAAASRAKVGAGHPALAPFARLRAASLAATAAGEGEEGE